MLLVEIFNTQHLRDALAKFLNKQR